MTRSRRVLLCALLTLLSLIPLSALPAQAASGGGCQNNGRIRSCISYSSGWVNGDFYLLSPGADWSYCTAEIQIWTNRNTQTPAQRRTYTLSYLGRYGPISANVATLPPSSGSAYTRVVVRFCTGTLHLSANSPRVYYP